MRRLQRALRTSLAALLLAAALPFLLPSPAAAQTLAVRGGTVHTLTGPPITDGMVLIRDGKIAQVGPAAKV